MELTFSPVGLGRAVAQASWQAGALALVVLGVQAAFGRMLSAGWRHALSLPVALRLIMPAAPESPWSLFNLKRLWNAKPAAPTVRVTTVDDGPDLSFRSWRPDKIFPKLAAPPPSAGTKTPRPLAFWLSAGWLMGVAVLSLRLLRAYFRFTKELRVSAVVNAPRVQTLWRECGQSAGVPRLPQIVETARVESPALFGFFQPRLLLPPGLADAFNDSELRHIFLHELAHLKRGDVLLNGLLVILQLVHWFNPLVWLAFARMRADRELACDALALSHAGESEKESYGQTIIKLMAGMTPRSSSPGLVGIMEGKTQIKTRIAMVANYRPEPRFSAPALCLWVFLALAGLSDAQTNDSPQTAATSTPIQTTKPSNPRVNALANQRAPGQTRTLPNSESAKMEPEAVPFLTNGLLDSRDQLWDGQTMALGGLISAKTTNQATDNNFTPVKLGRLFREEASKIADSLPAPTEPEGLRTRTFRVNPELFTSTVFKALRRELPPNPDVVEAARDLFKSIGVDFAQPSAPPNKALYFNDRQGALFVRATLRDLDVIESMISFLNTQPPNILVEAKVVEITDAQSKTLGFDWFLGNTKPENLTPNKPGSGSTNPGVFPDAPLPSEGWSAAPAKLGTVSGILTDNQIRTVVKALEQRHGVDILHAPKVTTLSGRRARVSIEPGPSVDILPIVGADGYSVELQVEFTWDKPIEAQKPAKPLKRGAATGKKEELPKTRRLFASTRAVIWDGQTMVIGLEASQGKQERRQTLLFVTPTVVDPAGNPVHAGGEGRPFQPPPPSVELPTLSR